MKGLIRYFFQGLLFTAPMVLTIYVVYLVFRTLDDAVFSRIGAQMTTSTGKGTVSLVGMVATVAIITLLGFLGSNLVGKRLVAQAEAMLGKLPLVKLLYGSIKDLLSAFVGEKKGFDRPVLVSLSGDGAVKVVGFVTRDSLEFLGIPGHVAVYFPQSYNFAGNLLILPGDRVAPLDVPSSDIMAFLISGGVSGEKPGKEEPSKRRKT
jgi:uncharacterized membrane protein